MSICLIKTIIPSLYFNSLSLSGVTRTNQLLNVIGGGGVTTLYNEQYRYASKKTSGSTRNQKGHGRPKHRGWKKQDGHWVEAGTILATQLNLRFHPGLNVGFGKNGTLFAQVAGHVMVTCERTDLNWDHRWVQRCYEGRNNDTDTPLYKKYFNVIPKKQHNHFKLIEQI